MIWFTAMQRLVPGELLGRVSSLDWMISILGTPISFLVVGPLAKAFGADAVLIAAGVLGAGATVVFAFMPGARDPERDGRLALSADRSAGASAAIVTPATPAIANAIVSPVTSDMPAAAVRAITAPASPAPTAMPRVSMSNVGESSRASAPSSALAITASGITGNAVPIPKPAAIQAMRISHNGDPCSTQIVTPSPTRKIIAPTETSQPYERRPDRVSTATTTRAPT